MSTRELPTRRLRALAEVALGRMRSPDRAEGPNMIPYLRAANVKDGSLDLSDVKSMDFNPSEQSKYALRSGDVLVTEGAGSLAAVGASAVWSGEIEGVVCFQNTLLRLRPRGDTNARYLMWWARHAYGSGFLASIAEGANIYHLGADNVRLLPASIPDPRAQRAIADYLDAETARIDTLVRAKRRLIDLLIERCTTAVADAVLKGRCGHAGSEAGGHSGAFLGDRPSDSPAHWQRTTIKRIADMKAGEAITAEVIDDAGAYPVFGGNGMRGFTSAFTHRGTYVLIGRQGALCGNINYADGEFWASEHAVVVSPGPGVDVRWLGELLRVLDLNRLSQSAAQPGLSVEVLEGIGVALPPSDEQKAIGDYVEKVTTRVDYLVAKTSAHIDLLQERRQALITAAVTGQLEIPGVAV